MIAICTRLGLCAFGVIGVLVYSSASAQPAGHPRQLAYDAAAEGTFAGVVQEVIQTAGPGMMGGRGRLGMEGVQIVLKAADTTVRVHLGPKSFLIERHVEVAVGDRLEILGARVAGQIDVVLAREIKKGEHTWTLRDAAGTPLWAHGRP